MVEKPSRRYGGLSVCATPRRAPLAAACRRLGSLRNGRLLEDDDPDDLHGVRGHRAPLLRRVSIRAKRCCARSSTTWRNDAHEIVRQDVAPHRQARLRTRPRFEPRVLPFFTEDPRRARIYALESLGVSPELEAASSRRARALDSAAYARGRMASSRRGCCTISTAGSSPSARRAPPSRFSPNGCSRPRKPSVEKMAETLTLFWMRTLRLD